ncbi:hypothetical protein GCM10009676_22920 [Prauserella halophila]|uniref:Uncharacterized protein n=1 Tax=Prauserella halophila TaxID=185641 RepID=A0ABN1W6F2_9PSEU
MSVTGSSVIASALADEFYRARRNPVGSDSRKREAMSARELFDVLDGKRVGFPDANGDRCSYIVASVKFSRDMGNTVAIPLESCTNPALENPESDDEKY